MSIIVYSRRSKLGKILSTQFLNDPLHKDFESYRGKGSNILFLFEHPYGCYDLFLIIPIFRVLKQIHNGLLYFLEMHSYLSERKSTQCEILSERKGRKHVMENQNYKESQEQKRNLPSDNRYQRAQLRNSGVLTQGRATGMDGTLRP